MSAAVDIGMLLTIGSFATIAVLAGSLAVVARRYFVRRAHELQVARKHLEMHFRAVDAILSDPAVGQKAKDLVVLFSAAVGSKHVAKALAGDLKRGSSTAINPDIERYVADAFEEIRQLSYLPDMQRQFLQVFRSGFLAAVMRFPETEALLPEATLVTSSVNDASSRKMAASVVASSRDCDSRLPAMV